MEAGTAGAAPSSERVPVPSSCLAVASTGIALKAIFGFLFSVV